MPRSKRDKKVSLTKTNKKPGLEFKQRLVDDIRSAVEQYSSIYQFTYDNLNNTSLNLFRKSHWESSRFYFGKNRIMQLGLGKTPETEAAPKLHRLAKHLNGHCGLLFTNEPLKEVTSWFHEFSKQCVAQAGAKAMSTIILPVGPITNVSSSMEAYLRSLGLPTELKKGQINLLEEYVLCQWGRVIQPNNAKLLKVLGHEVGIFKMHLKRFWSKDGSYGALKPPKSEDADVMEVPDQPSEPDPPTIVTSTLPTSGEISDEASSDDMETDTAAL